MNRYEIIEIAKQIDNIHTALAKQFCRQYDHRRTCEECPFYNEHNEFVCHLDHLTDIHHNLKYKNYND